MAQPELSLAAQALLDRQIGRFEDLEVFVFLADAPDRWWGAQNVARELHVGGAEARAALERLAAANLLDIRLTDDVRYRFRPGTEALRQAADDLIDAYRANPFAVARRVAAMRGRNLRDFADAFRMRRS